jgi:hypothetical protein
VKTFLKEMHSPSINSILKYNIPWLNCIKKTAVPVSLCENGSVQKQCATEKVAKKQRRFIFYHIIINILYNPAICKAL